MHDEGYDLVILFDCLHDMGDPAGTAKHVVSTLKADGTWMMVEPFANDLAQENNNPVGRIYHSASTMIGTPASLAQEVEAALGAQAGRKQIRQEATDAEIEKLELIRQSRRRASGRRFPKCRALLSL